MIDFQREFEQRKVDHAACKARETEAWQKALESLEKLQKVQRRAELWRNVAIIALIWQTIWLIRWWMGW